MVRIDVKPGDAINSINPKSNALLVVAILTTTVGDGGFTVFDPWDDIDRPTVRLGPGLAPALDEPNAQDVDFDGDIDMVFRFKTQQIGVTCGMTKLGLIGSTYDGDSVTGSDSIVTAACK